MAGKENCQYITFGWVLSASLELKVLKDRMWYNLGRPRSVGSSEKYSFKGSSHKVLKMLCDKDGSQGAGEVFVVSMDKAMNDAEQNHDGWREILDDYSCNDVALRNIASTSLLTY